MTVKRLKLKTLEETCKAVAYIKQYAYTLLYFTGTDWYRLAYTKEFRRKDINGNSFYNFSFYGIKNKTKIVNISRVIAELCNLKYDDKKKCIVGYANTPSDIETVWKRSESTAPELKLEYF